MEDTIASGLEEGGMNGIDSLMNMETFKGDLKHAKSSVLENRYSTEGQAKL